MHRAQLRSATPHFAQHALTAAIYGTVAADRQGPGPRPRAPTRSSRVLHIGLGCTASSTSEMLSRQCSMLLQSLRIDALRSVRFIRPSPASSRRQAFRLAPRSRFRSRVGPQHGPASGPSKTSINRGAGQEPEEPRPGRGRPESPHRNKPSGFTTSRCCAWRQGWRRHQHFPA
jgi:hypothetical protein